MSERGGVGKGASERGGVELGKGVSESERGWVGSG